MVRGLRNDCAGTRLYEALRSGHFILLTRGPTKGTVGTVDRPDIDHVNHCETTFPAALLIRPDGYIAWAAHRLPDAAELAAVLTRWCGEPAGVRCAIR